MSKRSIFLITISLITIVVWIIFQVFFALTSKEITADYRTYIIPLDEELDDQTIETINQRETKYMMIDKEDLE